jgi:anti-sigma regulatory factor (Ser/Thr protein kinase)
MQKLSIVNKIEEITKICRFIDQFAAENNLAPKSAFELNLVLEELVSNNIFYGFSDDKIHLIEILIELNLNTVKMQITDDGKEFNPLSYVNTPADLPLKDKPIGGLGLSIVKQKVDEISYQRIDNRNILYLTRKISINGE